MNLAKTLKNVIAEAGSLNDYLSSRGINPKFVSRDTKISHAKSALFQKWKSDRQMAEETILEASETELLGRYLNSRGINPKFVTKDIKIAHSKSGEFMKWKRDHQHFELDESVDKKDTVMLDIPLLIRVLELAREDIKTDMDLHRVVEKLISIRNKGVLTMNDYNTIANINENHIAIAMGNMLDDEGSMVLSQLEQLERAITMIRSYVGKDYEKQLPAWVQAKITLATDYADTVGNYITSKNEKVAEETVSEAKKPRITALEKWRKAASEREKKHNTTPTGDMKGAIDRLEKHLTKENTLDSLAATEAPSDNSDMTNGTSKAATMVKNLKKKTVKEETYDWEKDDKSSMQKPYGKAPKINVTDKKGTLGDTKPDARAVMKGGTTLTGQPRDIVEIDPSIQNRPNQDKGQSTFTKEYTKKTPA